MVRINNYIDQWNENAIRMYIVVSIPCKCVRWIRVIYWSHICFLWVSLFLRFVTLSWIFSLIRSLQKQKQENIWRFIYFKHAYNIWHIIKRKSCGLIDNEPGHVTTNGCKTTYDNILIKKLTRYTTINIVNLYLGRKLLMTTQGCQEVSHTYSDGDKE